MIKKTEVIRMKVPFPNINAALAVTSHMYICIGDGNKKEFVKCQTYKPIHEISSVRPFNFIKEPPSASRNPFNGTTTIDCDKSFCVDNVKMDERMLTTNRKDVCSELFTAVTLKTDHQNFSRESVDSNELCNLNWLATMIS